MRGFLKVVTFALKGAALGFVLGIAAAVFGTIIGSPFETILASGMPLGMAFLGALVFTLLAAIGMHDGFRDSYGKKSLYPGD